MARKIKFCYLEPPFPKKGFLVFIYLFHPEYPDKCLFYPLESLFKTLEDTQKGVKRLVRIMKKQGFDIPKKALLIPMELLSLYPLRKEFWEGPGSLDCSDPNFRMRSFIECLNNRVLYKILVLPTHKHGSKWVLFAATPFNLNTTNEGIDNFMKMSDIRVEYCAKHAAFYSFGESVGFNWKTREIEIDKKEEDVSGTLLN
jgi:hypothetical protein